MALQPLLASSFLLDLALDRVQEVAVMEAWLCRQTAAPSARARSEFVPNFPELDLAARAEKVEVVRDQVACHQETVPVGVLQDHRAVVDDLGGALDQPQEAPHPGTGSLGFSGAA